MGDTKLSRRQFFEKMSVSNEGFQPEHLFIPDSEAQNSRQTFEIPTLDDSITLLGGLDPYQGPWTKDQAAHLLRRTTFGMKKSHLDQMLALGNAEAAVDAILTVSNTPPAPPINNYNNGMYTDPLASQLVRQVATARFQGGFDRPHHIVVLHDACRALIGHGKHAPAIGHQGCRQPGHANERMTGNVHGLRETLRGTVK